MEFLVISIYSLLVVGTLLFYNSGNFPLATYDYHLHF